MMLYKVLVRGRWLAGWLEGDAGAGYGCRSLTLKGYVGLQISGLPVPRGYARD
jgi:hypothetical protein